MVLLIYYINTHPCLFVYKLSMAVSGRTVVEMIWPKKPKIFILLFI